MNPQLRVRLVVSVGSLLVAGSWSPNSFAVLTAIVGFRVKASDELPLISNSEVDMKENLKKTTKENLKKKKIDEGKLEEKEKM